jgi:copper(I)-binding protein
MKKSIIVSLFLLAIGLSACAAPAASSKTLSIEDAWARAVTLSVETPAGEATAAMDTMQNSMQNMSDVNSAVYLTIVNNTAQADRLTGAATDAAAAVEIHETTMENDVMSMHPVDGIDIAAGESVSLAPGGLHIMLIGLQRNLIAGEKLDLTLTFEKAGQVSVEAEIRQP